MAIESGIPEHFRKGNARPVKKTRLIHHRLRLIGMKTYIRRADWVAEDICETLLNWESKNDTFVSWLVYAVPTPFGQVGQEKK